MALALQIEGLCKSYIVPVLKDFEFGLAKGEVHALIGSNGAGKTTIAKILTGLTPRNAGEILLHGQPYHPSSKEAATDAGVVMVLQELNLIPTLTVGENLFLQELPQRFGIVNWAELATRTTEALARVGLESIAPDQLAGTLGVGQQQLVEIAGALTQQFSVLILDEPTAALTGPEIELLFENVNRLREDGVAIVYVSHRMDEIARIADRVTVLRDGRRIATHRVDEVETRQLVREMAGDEIAERKAPQAKAGPRDTGITVKALCSGEAVRGVSFKAFQGEILGIAGLIGSGRTETLRAIFGADVVDSGEVCLGEGGAPLRFRSPADAVRAGLGLIPEDRKVDGLLISKAVSANTSLATLEDHAPSGILNQRSEETAVEAVCNQLAVKRDSLDQIVGELSGGNQQKIVIARWLLRDCQVLFFDEPTRGIDVAAKEAIYETLDQLAAEGRTIVVVSSDLHELMSISHRIVVMSNGRITGEFTPREWSQEAITAAAFQGYNTEKEKPA